MTASQQLFRLHWKNHSPNFVTVFSQLLNSESLVDVTLAADGQQIQAHRVVLSACSTYFQDLFVKHPCQHPIVILKDIKFKDLCTVIHFMYYGEVNVQHDQLSSILKTAEVLHVKGFADVVDKELFSAALLTRVHSEDPTVVTTQFSDQSNESPEDLGIIAKRKRQRHGSSSIQSRSVSQELPHSPQSRREHFQASREGTSSSHRSTGSFENSSVIRSQSSLMEQSSVDSLAENDLSDKNGEAISSISPSTSFDIPSNTGENGSSSIDIPHPKQKRHRPLLRQERVIKKEGETCAESERASPVVQILHPIRPRSPKNTSDVELLEARTRPLQTAYLQLPTISSQLVRQRTQHVQSGSPGPAASNQRNASPTPTHHSLGHVHTSIPKLAVTPVAPNIVIEQYPTILRVVSVDDVISGNESTNVSVPALSRTPSQSGSSNTNTLQVPGLVPDNAQSISSHSFGSKLRLKSEDHLRRSVSNPGTPSVSSATIPSNGHCPVLRNGAALGCNYCWNTNDSHGRILRRKTKYHCPDCQANLCIVPCFQEYHEKFVTSSSCGTKPSGSQAKGHTASPQITKMSSI